MSCLLHIDDKLAEDIRNAATVIRMTGTNAIWPTSIICQLANLITHARPKPCIWFGCALPATCKVRSTHVCELDAQEDAKDEGLSDEHAHRLETRRIDTAGTA